MATTTAIASVSEATRQPDNLALLFQEMFTVIARLRANRQRLHDVEVFRMQIRNALKRVEQEALTGVTDYDMEDLRVATFAVVAFLDESILDSRNPFFEDWPGEPLQLELFGVFAAGEVFYRNVERLLARPDSSNVADLLEVHQICLLMGFRGRYGLCRTAVEIDNILQRMQAKIQRIRVGVSMAVWRPAAPAPEKSKKPARSPYWRVSRYLQLNWRVTVQTLLRRQKKQANAEMLADIDLHFAKVSGLKQRPTVLLLGDTGSAKSSLIAKAGLQAELLAGQGALLPTRTLNLWHGWNTLFVDPAGSLLADPAARAKLFRKLGPAPVQSVIVALDCQLLFSPGGAEHLAAKARSLQAMLSELSRELPRNFPVDIIFTKADQIPYFQDFAKNLNPAEAAESFGCALSHGQTVEGAFQSLYHFLADERKTLMAREREDIHLANIYEFPREFVKLRPLLVEFLTDMPRPRGFYFTGIRPAANGASEEARQWLFVKRLFSEVILAQSRPTPLTILRSMAAAAG